MRILLLLPLLFVIPLVMFSLLKSITGDAWSAVFLGLILMVTVVSSFAGWSAAGARVLGVRR